MTITTPKISHQDERGDIRDLVAGEPFDAVTVIRSRAGSTRGNHFHRETVQWLYLVEGRLRIVSRKEGEPPEEMEVTPEQLVRHDPMEAHSIFAVEDSYFVVFTRGPRGGEHYESDTIRLQQPLHASLDGRHE